VAAVAVTGIELPNEQVCLTVQDTGLGISPEIFPACLIPLSVGGGQSGIGALGIDGDVDVNPTSCTTTPEDPSREDRASSPVLVWCVEFVEHTTKFA